MEAVESLLEQDYPGWELCLGTWELEARVEERLRELASSDSRLRILPLPDNGGISANTNHLAALAAGDYLCFLDHDDYLEPHALREMAAFLLGKEYDLVYSDEDVVGSGPGIPSPPNLKPDWAPESLLSHNYICHLAAVRKSLFLDLGGLDPRFDGAQDYDLFLRVSEATRRIGHVRKVLYHWRRHTGSTSAGATAGAKPGALEAKWRAVAAHLKRIGEDAEVSEGTSFGTLRVRRKLRSHPLVDIIIPSMNKDGTLERCLGSIFSRTSYPGYRVTAVLNGEGDFSGLPADGRLRKIEASGPFNWSRVNNLAARGSEAEILVFLNDDIEAESADWLEGLVEHAHREPVGAAGPLLLYPDRTIQHSGLVLDWDYIGWDFNKDLPETSGGYGNRAMTIQNVSAVTGACLCTRRSVFESVGGFDESLPLAFNDVDYCLALLGKGLRVVYTPHVRLVHHESHTRGLDVQAEKAARMRKEADFMRAKWGRERLTDRYFDPSLFKPGADLEALARAYLGSAEDPA